LLWCTRHGWRLSRQCQPHLSLHGSIVEEFLGHPGPDYFHSIQSLPGLRGNAQMRLDGEYDAGFMYRHCLREGHTVLLRSLRTSLTRVLERRLSRGEIKRQAILLQQKPPQECGAARLRMLSVGYFWGCAGFMAFDLPVQGIPVSSSASASA